MNIVQLVVWIIILLVLYFLFRFAGAIGLIIAIICLLIYYFFIIGSTGG